MDFSHAEDICDGLCRIILSKKKINNIILSSGKKTYLNNIIKYLVKKNKINLRIKFDIKSIKTCLIGNNNYAKKLFGWKNKKNIFIAADEIYKKNL